MEGSNYKNQRNDFARILKEKIAKDLREGKSSENVNGANSGSNGKISAAVGEELRKRINDTIKDRAMLLLKEKRNIDANKANFYRNQINKQLQLEEERKNLSREEKDAQAKEMGSAAQKEMEKELSKEMGRVKAKVASRVLAGAAYRIAEELEEKANQGGHWAIFVFIFTFSTALIADIIDIFGDLLVETVVGAFLLWLIAFFLKLTIAMFWMFLMGGGHNKLFWKVMLRIILGLWLPIETIMVVWNWYDFRKDKKEAKEELADFNEKARVAIRRTSSASA